MRIRKDESLAWALYHVFLQYRKNRDGLTNEQRELLSEIWHMASEVAKEAEAKIKKDMMEGVKSYD
jgi:hypothetical protein